MYLTAIPDPDMTYTANILSQSTQTTVSSIALQPKGWGVSKVQIRRSPAEFDDYVRNGMNGFYILKFFSKQGLHP
jgi:hypothetical protein